MGISLKPSHLPRYGEIATLLLKHGRSGLPDEATATREDAERLVDDLEARGPTYIKLGQLLSTRADLLPPVYLEALARLQDDTEPFGFADVERIVEAEIGARLSKAFSTFDHKPLASASLAQVHRAALRDGRPVAVKVQRPDVCDRVEEDMAVIAELAAFVDKHTKAGRRYGFGDMVEEFRSSLLDELDYRNEAANLGLLNEHLADYDKIVVPLPVNDYSTERVLTMELVDGRNVGSLGPLALLDVDGRELADQLFRAYLDQILVHGFVHADPHPGNVLLTEDGRLALLDLGMVTRVSSEMQNDLLRLLPAIGEGHGADAADVMVEMGTPGADFDPEAFRDKIVQLVDRYAGATVGDIQAGRVVGEVARIAGESDLRPPRQLTMLAKALLNLDEVARRLDPSFDPNEAIRDHVAHVVRRRMLRARRPAPSSPRRWMRRSSPRSCPGGSTR